MKDTMHLRSIFAAVAIAALMVFGMVAAAGLAPSARTGLAFDPHPSLLIVALGIGAGSVRRNHE